MEKILEKDLFEPIHIYFEQLGYQVHAEVKGCDITATREDELVIIELKRTFNLELLIQAAKRQRLSEKVYVAIPKPDYSIYSKKWKDVLYIVRRLEVGLIVVSFKKQPSSVEVVVEPLPFDRKKSMQVTSRKKKSVTAEINARHGNFNIGGSTRVKLMTAYKENAIHIACCLKKFKTLSPAGLRKLGTGEKTLSILSQNFYSWFERVERGLYGLSKKGKEVFTAYPELVTYYLAEIDRGQTAGAEVAEKKVTTKKTTGDALRSRTKEK